MRFTSGAGVIFKGKRHRADELGPVGRETEMQMGLVGWLEVWVARYVEKGASRLKRARRTLGQVAWRREVDSREVRLIAEMKAYGRQMV